MKLMFLKTTFEFSTVKILATPDASMMWLFPLMVTDRVILIPFLKLESVVVLYVKSFFNIISEFKNND